MPAYYKGDILASIITYYICYIHACLLQRGHRGLHNYLLHFLDRSIHACLL
jgi:hypothetical protein